KIETITGRLTIESSPAITSLKGLEKLQSVNQLQIDYNDLLTDVTSLSALNTASFINIVHNHGLKSLQGLEGLRKLNGQLDIEYNYLLSDFCPLKPFLLQYTGDALVIQGNAIPTSKAMIISTCP